MKRYVAQCLVFGLAAFVIELCIAQKSLAESLFFAVLFGALMPVVDKASSELFNWLGACVKLLLKKKDT